MTPITSSAASETESARNFTPGRSGATPHDHSLAAAVGQVHVEQHDVGIELLDQRHRLGDRARPRRRSRPSRRARRAHPRGTDRGRRPARRDAMLRSCGSVSSTSVPSPGVETILAVPPARAIRPRSTRRRRGDPPAPARGRSRRRGRARRARRARRLPRGTPTISSTPETCAAFAIASRAASTSVPSRSSSGASPPRATSTRTPCSSSISAAAASSAPPSVSPAAGSVGIEPARSSRSCRRASYASAGSSPG